MDDPDFKFDSDTGDAWDKWGTKPRSSERDLHNRKCYNDKYNNIIIAISMAMAFGILFGLITLTY